MHYNVKNIFKASIVAFNWVKTVQVLFGSSNLCKEWLFWTSLYSANKTYKCAALKQKVCYVELPYLIRNNSTSLDDFSNIF